MSPEFPTEPDQVSYTPYSASRKRPLPSFLFWRISGDLPRFIAQQGDQSRRATVSLRVFPQASGSQFQPGCSKAQLLQVTGSTASLTSTITINLPYQHPDAKFSALILPLSFRAFLGTSPLYPHNSSLKSFRRADSIIHFRRYRNYLGLLSTPFCQWNLSSL